METIASLAGAGLGYTWNNLPGALYGYKLAKAAYNMAPYKRKAFFDSFVKPYAKKFRKNSIMRGAFTKWKVRPRSLQAESGVTTQYDRVTQYRKRRMPRYKKRRWVSFTRRVHAATSKELGTTTVLFNKSVSGTVPPTGGNLWLAAALYGYAGDPDGSTVTGMNDIQAIINNDNRLDQGGGTTLTNNAKFQFGSGVIDFTFRNAGQTGVELDVYELMFSTDSATNGNPIASFTDGAGGTGLVPGTSGTGIQFTDRGATLFDFPQALAADRMKVVKKSKYFLPAGATATLQHRDAKNFMFNAAQLQRVINEGYSKKYKTRVWMFCAKNIIGEGAAGTLFIGVSRKYKYTVMANDFPLDAYNPTT